MEFIQAEHKFVFRVSRNLKKRSTWQKFYFYIPDSQTNGACSDRNNMLSCTVGFSVLCIKTLGGSISTACQRSSTSLLSLHGLSEEGKEIFPFSKKIISANEKFIKRRSHDGFSLMCCYNCIEKGRQKWM